MARNWVQQTGPGGHLPPWIHRAAHHMIDKGVPEQVAIARAVAACKRYCATGHLTSDLPAKHFNPGERAEACASAAMWEQMKARAHMRTAPALEELPPYMQRVARHLVGKMGEEHAVATAVQTVRKFAATGETNLPGVQQINAASRAEAAAAVAAYEARQHEPAKAEPVHVTERPWDGSPARFTDAEWSRSCLVDRGGDAPVKQRCSLPVREPDGTLNRNAVHAAASRLASVKAPAAVIRTAAAALLSAYTQLGETPPENVKRLATAAAVGGTAAAVAANDKRGRRTVNIDSEQRTIDVDVGDLETRGRTVHGYAAVYGVLSEDLGGFRERIAPGAFADVLRDGADVRALLNHDESQVLGRTRSGTLRLFDEERGLRFELDLPNSPVGENVREAVRRGDIDGASFRMAGIEDEWSGETRTIRRVGRLLDCSVATMPAYPQASIEMRTRPTRHDETEDTTVSDDDGTEERTRGGLRVEERTARGNDAETTLLGRFRAAGWEAGVRAEIAWPEFLTASEQRALAITGDADLISVLRRDGVPLGADRRYAWVVFPNVGVDSGTTSVQVFRQTARTLPDPATVIRAIDATTPKPEAGSTVTVGPLGLNQVAAIQKGIPNVYLQQDGIRTIVGQDLRLAINEGLDEIVLAALAAAPFHDPTTDPLLVSIRKAITIIAAAGYNPDTLILRPEDSEELDVLQTSGSEKFYVFGAARFAPGDLFGLNVRVSKNATEPIVCDASATGTLYASPISLMTFEENAGETNTSLVRMEGHAGFGVERIDAAVRIAAA